jgi:DTW domain-containing protein YfiP
MHQREFPKTTATGPLALRALCNSALHIHGAPDAPLDLNFLHAQDRRVLLLFPGEQAAPLTAQLVARDARPITLVVPDGSWRQASRAARRIPGLERAERVTLLAGPPSEYRLRNEPRAQGLATFEAIARAIGVIESLDAQAQLETLFAHMVQVTLSTRGSSTALSEDAATSGKSPAVS